MYFVTVFDLIYCGLHGDHSPYLVSAAAALEAKAGDRGFVCHGDLGGGAGVPQVVLVDLSLRRSDHQTCAVQSEVHGGQRSVHSDWPQDAAQSQRNEEKIHQ